MSHRLFPPLAPAPLASLMACLFFASPCKAEEPAAAPDPYPQKTARFSIVVKKETYLEMLSSLPETKISANREKIIEDLVERIVEAVNNKFEDEVPAEFIGKQVMDGVALVRVPRRRRRRPAKD